MRGPLGAGMTGAGTRLSKFGKTAHPNPDWVAENN